MSFLETIGLITVIGVGGYVLGEHLKMKDSVKKRKEDIQWRAMYMSYRFALRHLYHQHHESNIREKLMRLAEHTYGGVNTIAIELSDEDYVKQWRQDPIDNEACDEAEKAIRTRGYPLAIEGNQVINLWGHGGHAIIA